MRVTYGDLFAIYLAPADAYFQRKVKGHSFIQKG